MEQGSEATSDAVSVWLIAQQRSSQSVLGRCRVHEFALAFYTPLVSICGELKCYAATMRGQAPGAHAYAYQCFLLLLLAGPSRCRLTDACLPMTMHRSPATCTNRLCLQCRSGALRGYYACCSSTSLLQRLRSRRSPASCFPVHHRYDMFTATRIVPWY